MFKVLFFLVYLSVVFAEPTGPECDKLGAKAEMCFKGTIFVDTFQTPRNLDDFKAYNQKFTNEVKCLKEYRKCMKGLSRQTYGMVINGLIKHGKYMFGKQSNATGILYSVQCLDPKIMKEVHDVVYLASTRISYIAKDATNFDAMCCTVRLMIEEVLAVINDENCKETSREAKVFVKRMMDSFFEDAAALLCTKQTDVAVCEKDYPSVMTVLRSVDIKTHGNNEFIIRPVLRLIEKMSK